MDNLELEKKINKLAEKLDDVEHWLFCVSEGYEYLEVNTEAILDKLEMEPDYPDYDLDQE